MIAQHDVLPCGYLRTERSGRILAANATLATTLGYPEASALPARLDALLPKAAQLLYELHLVPTLSAHGTLEEVYLDLLSRSGEPIPMLVNLKAAADEDAFDWALMRVTQRARWETAVLEARRDAERKTEEAATSAAQLAEALEELKENHWLLGKVAEVLPTCMYCGRVKAGETGWEEAIQYLKRNTTFLSHGCCPSCTERLLKDLV